MIASGMTQNHSACALRLLSTKPLLSKETLRSNVARLVSNTKIIVLYALIDKTPSSPYGHKRWQDHAPPSQALRRSRRPRTALSQGPCAPEQNPARARLSTRASIGTLCVPDPFRQGDAPNYRYRIDPQPTLRSVSNGA